MTHWIGVWQNDWPEGDRPGLDVKPFEFLNLSSLALISVAFYISRGRLYLYALLSLLIVGIFGFFAYPLTPKNDFLLTISGLFLYFFGLLIVRVMLQRSVSLQLLGRIAAADRRNLTLNPEIKGRFQDLITFKLATVDQDESYRLTRFGWMIGTFIRFLYMALRVQK